MLGAGSEEAVRAGAGMEEGVCGAGGDMAGGDLPHIRTVGGGRGSGCTGSETR